MYLLFLLVIAFPFLTGATTDLNKRWTCDSFVSVSDGHLELNDKFLRFYGTNAYWLQMISDEDLDLTLRDIAKANFTVVRTWAFNDVTQKPASGTYFQILNNGSATINYGPDGLQRLDKIVQTAAKYGLKLIFTLTNNWNPEKTEPASSFKRWNNNVLPRAYLSNDYGGMDLYNRAYSSNPTHDLFYTQPDIISAFKNYISQVIPRYANDSTVLGWELGNDLRCSSTLPASPNCNPQTITKWVAEISSYIKTLDPCHLVTPGDGGFYCAGCPKLYAQQSSGSGSTQQKLPGGPTFDGSFGVDTQDLISVPSIDFGSFQLFPDQVHYFLGDEDDHANTAISQGRSWVAEHSQTSTALHKPIVLTAFSIVTNANFQSFVPFNESTTMQQGDLCAGGVEEFQRNYAFVAWASVMLNANIGGALEYQWLQKGLQDVTGRRAFMTSPQDGGSNYQTPYTDQNAQQVQHKCIVLLAAAPPGWDLYKR